MVKKDIQQLKKLIESADKSIEEAKNIFKKIAGEDFEEPKKNMEDNFSFPEEAEKIIEGNFDGQSMIDDTGKIYPIPANYASKSKLVEGDRLKLTIAADGSFLFKQIGPVERRRIIALVTHDISARGYALESEGKRYKVLLASITYFKVGYGDSVVAIVPKDAESSWAAIENALQGGGEEHNFNSLNSEKPRSNKSEKSKLAPKDEQAVKNLDEIIGDAIGAMEEKEEKNNSGEANEFEW